MKLALLISAATLACALGCGSEGSGSDSSGGSSGVGGATSSGGATTTSGGSGSSSGGSGSGTGGATGGTGSASGGSSATGGGSATGGSNGSGGTSGDNAAALARVAEFITKLPDWAQANIGSEDLKNQIIDAIVKSCIEFAPPGDEWQIYCEAQIASSMLKESSYQQELVVTDGYATRDVSGTPANDPTIGFLQVRFSSTVSDYNALGPLDKMQRIGCDFQDFGHDTSDQNFWAVTGPTANLTFMETPACNIGLATWYYYYNATGNGDANNPTYLYQYCQGNGVPANLIIGLLSHLRGPGGAHQEPTATDPYVVAIKDQFQVFLGTVDPDPFTIELSPDTTKYCR
jgi:hypothetical protein